jgi:hypothetical protein
VGGAGVWWRRAVPVIDGAPHAWDLPTWGRPMRSLVRRLSAGSTLTPTELGATRGRVGWGGVAVGVG